MRIDPIGTIRSPFAQRFGIPRQAGIVKKVKCQIELRIHGAKQMVQGLEGFSHIWVIFAFHKNPARVQVAEKASMVRPPRLGGQKKVGVFATRAPFRPNPIGLSAVRLEQIEYGQDFVRLHICGGDFLDGSPVFDIKPYVPYCDRMVRVNADLGGSSLRQKPRSTLKVIWANKAKNKIKKISTGSNTVKAIVTELIALDPRPRSTKMSEGKYAMYYGAFDYHFTIKNSTATIQDVFWVNGI